jgi:Uma2 family endonuclease
MSTMTFIADNARVSVPSRVLDPMSLDEFRNWVGGEDLPEKCVVYYVRGEWGIDVSKELILTHGGVKTAVASALFEWASSRDLGHYFANGVLLVNSAAKLACNPERLYVSFDAIKDGRIVAVERKVTGHVEWLGKPDMVLEVISASSVKKDTSLLLKGYGEAGAEEYWLVDARAEKPTFRILTRGAKGFVDVKPTAGWHKSAVFGASFKFVKSKDPLGNPRFRLEIKS